MRPPELFPASLPRRNWRQPWSEVLLYWTAWSSLPERLARLNDLVDGVFKGLHKARIRREARRFIAREVGAARMVLRVRSRTGGNWPW